MDAIDRAIARLLYAHGRMSQEELAREVHLSRAAVHGRLRRLEDQGVIRGYRALLNWAALGQPVTAFVWVRTSGVRCHAAGQSIMQLSGPAAVLEECHRVTGDWCMLLKVRAGSTLDLQDLIDRIRDVPGVTATMTTVVLSTLSEQGASEG